MFNPTCPWLLELRQTLGGADMPYHLKIWKYGWIFFLLQSLPWFALHQNNNCQGASCKTKVSEKKLRRKTLGGGRSVPPRATRVKHFWHYWPFQKSFFGHFWLSWLGEQKKTFEKRKGTTHTHTAYDIEKTRLNKPWVDSLKCGGKSQQAFIFLSRNIFS